MGHASDLSYRQGAALRTNKTQRQIGFAARDADRGDTRHEFQRQRRMSIEQRPQARQKNVRRKRSEEHTSELQSLMRISYAVFCLKKKNNTHTTQAHHKLNKSSIAY